jgi:hypothetical protein
LDSEVRSVILGLAGDFLIYHIMLSLGAGKRGALSASRLRLRADVPNGFDVLAREALRELV